MATDLPKVQGYVPPVVYDKLLEYRETHGLKSISQAVTNVLMDFFGVTDSPVNQISESLPTRMNSLEGKVADLGRQLEELNQVVTRFTSDSPIDPLQDTSKTEVSELDNELKLDSPLEPPEGRTNATEEPSESSRETSFESLQEASTTGLRKSTDELLSKSPTKVPEGETQNSSETSSKSSTESLGQKEMQMRLNVNPSTLASAKKRPDFPQWSQVRDPDNIAWRWNAETKDFVPAADNR